MRGGSAYLKRKTAVAGDGGESHPQYQRKALPPPQGKSRAARKGVASRFLRCPFSGKKGGKPPPKKNRDEKKEDPPAACQGGNVSSRHWKGKGGRPALAPKRKDPSGRKKRKAGSHR